MLGRPVEGEEAQGLEERHPQLLHALLEVGAQDAVAKVGLPLQLATGVLAVVELLEDFQVVGHLNGNVDLHWLVGGPVRHREDVYREVDASSGAGVCCR